MGLRTYTIYDAGTITANGNSGWIQLPPPFDAGVSRAFIRLVPANLATDETLDIVFATAFDIGGSGSVDTHTFTQITATNAAANLVLPGGESVGLYTVATKNVAPLPPFWKFTWTVGGTTKSMTFVVYAVLELFG